MDTLIRRFREHAVQGTAGSQLVTLKTVREDPAPPRTVPMLHTQTRVTRTLSLSEYFSSGMETATQLDQPLCIPGWMGDQRQLPASQGEASRRSMPLGKSRRHQPESSHGTPHQGSVCRHRDQSPRAGEWAALRLHSAKPGWATRGRSPGLSNGKATQKGGWMRKLERKGLER